MTDFRSACEAILRKNDRGAYTVPSPRLYPHQWAWDSAFAVIGWTHVDPKRALTELQTLMAGQWRDGRVPHIQFHLESADYFPGPDFWETASRTPRTSTITQPPVWATAARRLVEVAGPSPEIAALVPAFDASHRFFHAMRDPLGWGAVAIVHPWESGLDNCPAWDVPMARIDITNPPPFRRKDTEVVGDASMRPTEDDYKRYAVLVKEIAKDDFGAGNFAVYDPLMTAILARAETDLAWIAAQHDVASETRAGERATALEAALVENLWDDDVGRFVYYDVGSRERITADVIGCYVPLWCRGAVDADKRGRLLEGLRERYLTSAWPVPSTAPAEPTFDPRRYWRGPTWININWLLVDALGEELAKRTVELVRTSGFREYFHPETGEGLGGEDFMWTAALALDLVERGFG